MRLVVENNDFFNTFNISTHTGGFVALEILYFKFSRIVSWIEIDGLHSPNSFEMLSELLLGSTFSWFPPCLRDLELHLEYIW